MIYDITRELFSCSVYPGDPVPHREAVLSMESDPPAVCNLSRITMGSHSGTHLDAPLHFCQNGHSAADMRLRPCLGKAKVVEWDQELTPELIVSWTEDKTERLLIKGNAWMTPESARQIVDAGLLLIGVERNTVGDEQTGTKIHQILLGSEVVILEALDLENVPSGSYLLSALPLKMAGSDGSPVRAVLAETQDLS